MFYHVYIELNLTNREIKDLYECDISNLEEIKKDILKPFFLGNNFFFNGSFIKKTQIRKILIKSSSNPSSELTKDFEVNIVTLLTDEYFNTHINDITRKVFIVHGHDDLAKNEVARFIEKLGFEAIILHEQTSSGKTIIEKIEEYSNVGFGIVLYTPCDIGAKKDENSNLKPRARQNVVFEHGFLIGKIGRSNVCALVKDSVEKPNDISGIVYISMESNWQIELAKEMKKSGYDIDFNKIFK